MSDAIAVDLAVDQRAVKGSGSSVLGMTLFVASEGMFFAAFFGAYFTIYAATKIWPPLAIPIPDVTISGIATALLVLSGFTMSAGVGAARNGKADRLNLWLVVTIVLGVAFLILQAYDYGNTGFSIHDGTYASLYYIMTGLHMAHVVGGVVLLILVFFQSKGSEGAAPRKDPVKSASIYWHFVDIVWVGLFVIFYLLPQGDLMGPMSRSFRWLALFLIVDAAVYMATAREWTGGPLIATTAVAFAYLALVIGRAVRRAAKEQAADPSTQVGAVELDHVGPTIWPAISALSAIILAFGAASARLLLIPGGILLVASAVGWATDVQRQHKGHHPTSEGPVSSGSGTPAP